MSKLRQRRRGDAPNSSSLPDGEGPDHARGAIGGRVSDESQRLRAAEASTTRGVRDALPTLPRTDSSDSSLDGFASPPSLERILSSDILAESILDVTLRRRRFVLLIGLALGLIAPLAWHGGTTWHESRDVRWLEDFNLTETFATYIHKSKTAFDRARAELKGFAPADIKLLYQLQEVMDFTKETKTAADAPERPGVALRQRGLRAKHPVILVPGKWRREKRERARE